MRTETGIMISRTSNTIKDHRNKTMIIFRIIEIVISRTGSIIKNRRNKMIIVFQTKTINKTGSTTIKDRHQIGTGINSNNKTGILIQTGITTRDRMSIATGITIVVHGSLLSSKEICSRDLRLSNNRTIIKKDLRNVANRANNKEAGSTEPAFLFFID
jgi:hypothetical protein